MITQEQQTRTNEKDLGRTKDGQQIAVGFYQLRQGEDIVGRLLVLEDGSTSIEYWELFAGFIQPSWVNTSQGIHFVYLSAPITKAAFEEDIRSNSQYIIANCQLQTR